MNIFFDGFNNYERNMLRAMILFKDVVKMIPYCRFGVNFECINKKSIILFGASIKGRQIKNILYNYNIKIQFFCDNDISKQGTYVEGIKVLSQTELENYCNSNLNSVIIISSMYYKEILNQLKGCNLYNKIYLYKEVLDTIEFNLWESNRELMIEINKQEQIDRDNKRLSEFLYCLKSTKIYNEYPCIVHTMYKSGTHSLFKTLRFKYGKNVFLSIHHLSKIVSKGNWYRDEFLRLLKDSKMVVTVRDSLSRIVSGLNFKYDVFDNYMYMIDMQKVFDEVYIYSGKKYSEFEYQWFNEEVKNIIGLDIFDYSFNKEKGYKIIKLEGGGDF